MENGQEYRALGELPFNQYCLVPIDYAEDMERAAGSIGAIAFSASLDRRFYTADESTEREFTLMGIHYKNEQQLEKLWRQTVRFHHEHISGD